MRRKVGVLMGSAAVLVAGMSGSAAGAVSAHHHHPSQAPAVVMTGLNNPRQLSWGPDGSLFVAEAGRGSLSPGSDNCFTGPEGETCVGATGSVSLIRHPSWTVNDPPRRVVTGLMSGAAPDGGSAVGSDGVSYDRGSLLIQETYAPPEVVPADLPAWQLGKLLRARGPHLSVAADITAVEQAQNPDGLQIDSDPYAVLSLGWDRSITADAAGNDLILVDHGRARPLTVFPLHGCGGVRTEECDQEPVPTSLALGPGHALYVGELAHFEPGEARVWKVSPASGQILGYYGKGGTLCPGDTAGFTTVTGVAFGRDGSLYVSELFGGADGQGDIVRITRDCERSSVSVPLPGGVTTDRSGNVYVSAFSVSDADGATPEGAPSPLPPGQVWRLRF